MNIEMMMRYERLYISVDSKCKRVKQTKQTKVKRLSIDRMGAVLQLREEKFRQIQNIQNESKVKQDKLNEDDE